MFTISSTGPTELIAVGLAPGDLLLESIEKAVTEHDVQYGAVISGIGTMKKTRLHYVNDCEFPPTDVMYDIEEPFELASIDGLIVDGKPHLHISGMVRDQKAYAGHLEPGSEVLYLAEVLIMKCNDLAMTREADTERKIKLLKAKE